MAAEDTRQMEQPTTVGGGGVAMALMTMKKKQSTNE
jgi:hypothetical protein